MLAWNKPKKKSVPSSKNSPGQHFDKETISGYSSTARYVIKSIFRLVSRGVKVQLYPALRLDCVSSQDIDGGVLEIYCYGGQGPLFPQTTNLFYIFLTDYRLSCFVYTC